MAGQGRLLASECPWVEITTTPLIGYNAAMNEQTHRWTIIYGMVLINIFIFGYKLLSPEHRFYRAWDSWQHFLVFASVCGVLAFIARAIAIWQFHRK
jgi:hypothetical protein